MKQLFIPGEKGTSLTTPAGTSHLSRSGLPAFLPSGSFSGVAV